MSEAWMAQHGVVGGAGAAKFVAGKEVANVDKRKGQCEGCEDDAEDI